MFFDKVVKMINFMKYWPTFKISCYQMGMKHCCLQKYVVSLRKSTPGSELQAEQAIHFMEQRFYLKELTNCGPDLGVRHTLSCKWSESCPFQEINSTICCQWQNAGFQAKPRILENLYLSIYTWQSPNSWNFSDETDGDINEHDFRYCIVKYVNFWKLCITQWTGIFQRTNISHYQKNAQVKDTLKI